MDKHKALIGTKKDCGNLQVFYQSTDTVKQYQTTLNGEYNLKLVDLKVISAAAAGTVFSVQIISNTLKCDRGNTNDNYKFVYRDGCNELPSPIMFYDIPVRGWFDLDFLQLGAIGTNINASAYNILLTFEYERL